MNESRTKNSIRNAKTGMIVQIVNKVMAFVVRTVFIQVLNSDYLGVNGLFTNILTILSFAELGVGTAIIYNMYKPIADNDVKQIKALMNLYKKAYTIIGISIFFVGLLVIPFMDLLVKDAINVNENIILIYILFLINTSISYFFTYKKSIITAHQKQRIINNIDTIFYLIKNVFEILFLYITGNYIVFLLIQIIGTLSENIYLAHKANKMYPYLKEDNKELISDEDKRNIFSNVRALVVYKFGGVIMNGTDNILISSMVNVTAVGLCSNYTLVINSIKSIINSAFNGITASVGNLNAISSKENKEKVFYQLILINYFIYSFCTVAFIILLNPFMELWIGKNYVMEIGISISLAISFFIEGLRNPGYVYRITLGLFEKGKMTPYIGAVTNIIMSIILCNLFGVVGIFIATSIAQLISYSWIDPYLIHKYEFKTPFKKYLKKYIIYMLSFIFILLVTYISTYFISFNNNILNFVIKILIVLIIPNILNILFYIKTDEFNDLKTKFLNPLVKKFAKR